MLPPESRFDSIVLQERDHALLRGLFEARVMTAAHVAVLFFGGRKEAAKKRLQKLKTAGYLAERSRKAYEPSVLFLTRKALTLLGAQGVLAEYPPISLPALEKRASVSDRTIQHELEVMDVKAAFHSAISEVEELSLPEFGTWPLLYEFTALRSGYGGTEVAVKPDGFTRIHEQEPDGGLSEHTFFLELDRSTETQDTLVSRAGCYLDYFKSGSFALKNGAPRSAFKDYPFRVLMVFKNAERRNNTAERLLAHTPPILTQVCLTTFDEVKANPLDKIWIRPIDYREAVKGTRFEAARRQTGRQPERDALVAEKMKPRSLLAD